MKHKKACAFANGFALIQNGGVLHGQSPAAEIDDFAAESTMLLKQRSFFKVIEIFHCDPPKGNVKKEKSPESVRKSNRTIPASYYITLQPIL